jgi:hypothetical protein
MKVRYAVLVVLAATVTLSSVAAAAMTSGTGASTQGARQRVFITSSGVANPVSTSKFVLRPQRPGRIKRDSGTETETFNARDVVRAGQKVTISTWVYTLRGKRGTFVIGARIEYVEAGARYHVGVGTWKVVRGTGQYAGMTGKGRIGSLWRDGGIGTERRDGFLTLP